MFLKWNSVAVSISIIWKYFKCPDNLPNGCVKKCDMCYWLRVTLSVHQAHLLLTIIRFEKDKAHKPITKYFSHALLLKCFRHILSEPWKQLNNTFQLFLLLRACAVMCSHISGTPSLGRLPRPVLRWCAVGAISQDMGRKQSLTELHTGARRFLSWLFLIFASPTVSLQLKSVGIKGLNLLLSHTY